MGPTRVVIRVSSSDSPKFWLPHKLTTCPGTNQGCYLTIGSRVHTKHGQRFLGDSSKVSSRVDLFISCVFAHSLRARTSSSGVKVFLYPSRTRPADLSIIWRVIAPQQTKPRCSKTCSSFTSPRSLALTNFERRSLVSWKDMLTG
jgi:hypothetical protein